MNLLSCCLFFCIALPVVNAKETVFDCQTQECGLLSGKAYGSQIVGYLDRVADPAESEKIFKWGRKNKRWQHLPAGADDFYKSVGIVSISSDGSGVKHPVSVMLPRPEVDAIQFKPGDLVRYTPHRRENENPPENTPEAIAYWSVTGCVAVLCRAADKACHSKYKQGVYRLPDGVQVTLAGKPYPNGIVIDTQSMLPATGQK